MKANFINERLQYLGKTQSDLAKLLAIPPSAANKLVKGLRPLHGDEVAITADFLEYNVEDFARYVSGDDSVIVRDVKDSSERSVKIPYMNVSASAGQGVYTDVEYIQSFLRVSLGKFANQLGKIQDVKAIMVAGNSMHPTLHDGDIILVDVSDRVIMNDTIYVVAIGEELFVKRLFINPVNKKIILKSDNRLHAEFDASEDELQVCGRVIMNAFHKL